MANILLFLFLLTFPVILAERDSEENQSDDDNQEDSENAISNT